MIIIGHNCFNTDKKLYRVSSIDEIGKTPANSTLFVPFDAEIISFLKENSINFATYVDNKKGVIFASSFGAKYILVEKNMAKEAQSIANDYLFDSRVVAMIDSDEELDEMIDARIDGVLYEGGIV